MSATPEARAAAATADALPVPTAPEASPVATSVGASPLAAARAKLDVLRSLIAGLPGALVAYSGGVDSALLAEVAHQVLGPVSTAVTADSPSLARRELAAARELARSRGWQHLVLGTAEMDNPRYRANPVDRCYHCKSALFDRLEPLSVERGVPVLLGTVCDDLGDWRPGQRAATERGGRHPLVEAALSKAEVRALSASLGLPTAAKPASACLASRLAYGVAVTAQALARVEAAEELMAGMGFSVLRVRDLGRDQASVEVGPDELDRLLARSEQVSRELLGLGFARVAIDPRGYRRGALNERVVLPLTVGPSVAVPV